MNRASLPSDSPQAGVNPQRRRRLAQLRPALAGLLGAVIGCGLLYEFPVSWEHVHEGTAPPSQAEQQLMAKYRVWNMAVIFGTMGAAIALGCVCGQPVWGRSWKVGLALAPASLLLGSVAGVAGLWCALRFPRQWLWSIDDLGQNIIYHLLIWSVVGLAAGFTAALPVARWGSLVKATIAGALGGVVSAAFFVVGAAVLFPSVVTDDLVPRLPIERFALFGLNGLMMGLFIGLALAPSTNTAPTGLEPQTTPP